ncbi:MAG: type II toxin-antitoxin system RelB/DinJ family antitoxin [Oscillospiraceae bacterium]|jgi:DNA-damage-inducible protein J|nr:type II toxin-antitoxin system RelB/DinJ family antitoxin [Oscillospiraceae bacterium]
MATKTFSVRLDSDIKDKFDHFCFAVGMYPTTAINMFARAVVREQRLPCEVTTKGDPFYSESNMAHLREAISDMNAGRGIVRKTIAELEAMEHE